MFFKFFNQNEQNKRKIKEENKTIDKLVFTFLLIWCMMHRNRVGDLASSAAKMGSCLADEGLVRDEIFAPAAP